MRRSLPTALVTLLAGAACAAQAQLAPDSRRPSVRLDAPSHASDRGLTRAVVLRWSGADRESGIARFSLEARRSGNASIRWKVVRADTRRRRAIFRGLPGSTYDFRLRARDQAGNLSRYDYDQTIVPLDDRSPRVGRSRGWTKLSRRAAYGRTLSRSRRPGRVAELRFGGLAATVVATRTPRGGRVRVLLDGKERIVSLRGRQALRQVVFRSRLLRPGRHALRLETLDRGIVDLDGIGIDSGPHPPPNSPR
jgi:hypothetical protein